MPSFRCSLCGIAYPPHKDFQVCPIHTEPNTPDPGHDPDPDWRERAQRLWKQLKQAAQDDLRPYPRVEGVRVTEESGLLWVRQTDLINAGLRLPINGCFQLFELDGYVYETQGWDENGRRWWVEKLTPSIILADESPKPKAQRVG